MNMISEEVLALEPDIIAWRRHMHQNPELSFQEVHTTAYLTEELKKIPGLTLEFPTKTGVVAVLKGVQPGPVLALRADIDEPKQNWLQKMCRSRKMTRLALW